MASRNDPLEAPTIEVLMPFMRLPLEVPRLSRGEPNESQSEGVLEMAMGAGMMDELLVDVDVLLLLPLLSLVVKVLEGEGALSIKD